MLPKLTQKGAVRRGGETAPERTNEEFGDADTNHANYGESATPKCT